MESSTRARRLAFMFTIITRHWPSELTVHTAHCVLFRAHLTVSHNVSVHEISLDHCTGLYRKYRFSTISELSCYLATITTLVYNKQMNNVISVSAGRQLSSILVYRACYEASIARPLDRHSIVRQRPQIAAALMHSSFENPTWRRGDVQLWPFSELLWRESNEYCEVLRNHSRYLHTW